MTELRLDGKTEDGNHLSLVDGDGKNYSVRISDTLRATVNQPRLTSVPAVDAQETISVKEIQRRLRAGESFEQIARDGQTTVEKVERFSGPIMQEREYILSNARDLVMRKDAHRIDLTFGEVVLAKLAPRGVDTDQVSWNTWRQLDGVWHIELHYPNRDGNGVATWNFDLARRALDASDDNGAWLIDEEAPTRISTSAMIYSEPTHPSRLEEPKIEPEIVRIADLFNTTEEKPETPRLAVIRETPTAADSQDGITSRAKVPSWDEIMFGRKSEETPEDN
ncbi:septation protein SepH [Candidatus Planktophila dulcis]|uniref:septation protein SepH n=1 Tax=Candidatus Planktophila dulcis TaxID=1884914 RepID=UPI003CF8F071